MNRFEYKVVPAPRRGEKLRGVKTTEDRFALALTNLMNALGAEGWEYIRADALPCDERAGLTGGTKTSFQNMLVFRRGLEAGRGAETPAPLLRIAQEEVAEDQLDLAPESAPAPTPLRLGSAEPPLGTAPALGPAKPSLAAE